MYTFSRTAKLVISMTLLCLVVLGGAAQAAIKKNKTGCSDPIQSSGFVKTYHIKDSNTIDGVSLASDGGYILTGGAIVNKYMGDDDAFIMKVNSEGKKQWASLIQSKNIVTVDPLLEKVGKDRGHTVTQLSDGGYVLAGETTGFLTDELFEKQEFPGDVLLSKFDSKGRYVWSKTLDGLSLDIPVNIFADDSGGFFLSAAIAEVGYTGADYLHHFIIGKFDSSGEKVWMKNTGLLSSDSLVADTKSNQHFFKDSSGNILLTGMVMEEKLAVVVKLDQDGKTVWSKSLEGVPTQINGVKYRVPAGSFYAVGQTEDKGYLVFGLLSPLVIGGQRAKVATPEYLVAVKLDVNGNYMWAKAVGIGVPLTGFFTTPTNDGGFVFIKNYKAWNNKSDEDYAHFAANKKNVQKKTQDELDAADVSITKILAIKTDRDFNVQWAKKIGVRKEFFGFDVKATPDHGVVIAGLQRKSVVSDVLHGQTFYYDDALLVKLDANGSIGTNFGLISSYSAISAEDLSAYIMATDFALTVKNDSQSVMRKQNPNIVSANVKVNDLSVFKNYKITVCPPESTAKTWAQVNFGKTAEIDNVAKGKSQEVHEEMLPILQRVFKDVKLIDNIGGFSMEYTVGRLVTQADMASVQKELETLGYTLYEKDVDQLIMNKIGRMLVVGFSTNDRLRGLITVSF